MSTRTELGCAGHYICARHCRWHRHTQVVGDCGRYRISSVGDAYLMRHLDVTERQIIMCGERRTVGYRDDDWYETMVFTLTEMPVEGCDCLEVTSWDQIDGRRYATASEAQAGHERLVAYYMRAADGDER